MKARIPGGMGGGQNAMLKKVQQMQEDMAALQSELETREYSGVSGGGMINVTLDGKYNMKQISISPDAVDPDDIEMLEDLITVAVNEAVTAVAKTAEEEMSQITGGLNIPGMPAGLL